MSGLLGQRGGEGNDLEAEGFQLLAEAFHLRFFSTESWLRPGSSELTPCPPAGPRHAVQR
jgi:hypothetical protein